MGKCAANVVRIKHSVSEALAWPLSTLTLIIHIFNYTFADTILIMAVITSALSRHYEAYYDSLLQPRVVPQTSEVKSVL